MAIFSLQIVYKAVEDRKLYRCLTKSCQVWWWIIYFPMSSISEKSFGKPGEKDSWVFLQRMLERGPQSHPSKSDVQPRCCFVALAFLREFQGVQDRLLVDVFLMGWRSQQHWICSLGISLKKAEKMGFLAWREEPLLVRPCNYLKTLHVKLDAAAEQLSRALPVQKTLISLAWIVLQSRAKNNVIERAAQLFFFFTYIMAFLSFGKMLR